MDKEKVKKYIMFKKKIKFFSFIMVDEEKIGIQICKNIIFQQPYSDEWDDYIKKTCLQIYPRLENPLRIFSKLYYMKKMTRPKEKAFQRSSRGMKG